MFITLCQFVLSVIIYKNAVTMYHLINCCFHEVRSAALTMRPSLYPQKLALTSPTSGGRSVGIVRSRTIATELVS
jgi:hypothetical protein